MTHAALVVSHAAGALLLGAGIVGSLVAAERARRMRTLKQLDDALRVGALFEQRVLAPGVVLLLVSGSWLVVSYYGGWRFVDVPWLAGMVLLFAFESARGATLKRGHVIRLARLVEDARARGRFVPELDRVRNDPVAAFGRFLEATVFVLLVALGVFRPQSWTMFWGGTVLAVSVAAMLTSYVGRPGSPDASLLSSASVDGDGRS